MAKNAWWFIKVETGAAATPPVPVWCPSLIFYEIDTSPKGLALFTSREAAQQFSDGLHDLCHIDRSIVRLGRDGVSAADYVRAVAQHLPHGEKVALGELPVYVDPPDCWCKQEKVAFKNLARFFWRHMQEDVPWDCEPVDWYEYRGCTICVMRDAKKGCFVAKTAKGVHSTPYDMGVAIEDAIGTTEEKLCVVVDGYGSDERALDGARLQLDKALGPET